jgi:ATP-dependent protease HslVU (ClpYQ) peptidase subunit
MTCIVGLRDSGRVIIAGDSAGTAGHQTTIRVDRKVFSNGPYVMGFTTSFRMGQLLAYALDPPKPPKRSSHMLGFMVTDFIDSVRDCLTSGGYATKEDNVETGGTFLVGVHGHLYAIDSDYQVGIPSDGYAAVGCGDDIALGALYVTRSSDLTPEERCFAALKAASHHSAGVAAPFHLVSTNPSS